MAISGGQGRGNCYAKHLHIVTHLMLKLMKDTVTGHCLMKVNLANNKIVCITPHNNFYYLYVSQKTL